MTDECPRCGLVVSPEERELCQPCRDAVREQVAEMLERIGFGKEEGE